MRLGCGARGAPRRELPVGHGNHAEPIAIHVRVDDPPGLIDRRDSGVGLVEADFPTARTCDGQQGDGDDGAGDRRATAQFALPLELRNQVTRIEIAGDRHQAERAQRSNPCLRAGQRVNDAVARTQQRHRALRNVTATDNQ